MLASFRPALRGLIRAQGFSAVTILTLALGIGSATAIFSVVDWVLFREYVDATEVPAEEMQAMFATWFAWSDRLGAVGKYVGENPLEERGKVVRGATGESITDGPLVEAKEVLCGYFFINSTDFDEACRIAAQCLGLPRGMSVEVRPIMTH